MAFLLALVMALSTPITANATETKVGEISEEIQIHSETENKYSEEISPQKNVTTEENKLPDVFQAEDNPSGNEAEVTKPAEDPAVVPQPEVAQSEEDPAAQTDPAQPANPADPESPAEPEDPENAEEELLEEETVEDEDLLNAVKEDEEVVVTVTATDSEGESVYFKERKDLDETDVVEFASWLKAISFINTQKKKYNYIITLAQDVSIPKNLPLPTTAKSVEINTNGNQLSLGGNITLTTDLVLPNEINPTVANSTIALNNHHLILQKEDMTKFTINGTEANSLVQVDRYTKFGKLNINKLAVCNDGLTVRFMADAKINTAIFENYFNTNTYEFDILDGKKLNIAKGFVYDGETATPGEGTLSIGKLDTDENILTFNAGDLLFSTSANLDMKAFALRYPADYTGEKSLIIYREGNNLFAGRNCFTIYNHATDEQIGSCATWNSVISTLNSLPSQLRSCRVETSEDIVFNGGITMPSPKKCMAILIKGNGSNTLSYKGDLNLPGHFGFMDITLRSSKANPKFNMGKYKSAFYNVKFEQPFASVTGTGPAYLEMENTDLVSVGTISIPLLQAISCNLKSVNGGFSSTNALALKSTTIDVKTSVTLKDLYSDDNKSKIIYGQTAKDKFTISGRVNSEDFSKDVQILAEMASKENAGQTDYLKVSEKAIDVRPKFLTDNDYVNASKYFGKDIIYTKYSNPRYFVVEYNDTGAKYAFKRTKDALRLADDFSTKEVEVLELRFSDKCSWGTYNTIKEAFADIDCMGNKETEYIIRINEYDNDKQSSSYKENLTTPKNAKSVTIEAASAFPNNEILAVNNVITLNSDLILKGVDLHELKNKNSKMVPITINLNSYKLTLDSVDVPQRRIGSVVGNGVNGKSALEVINSGTQQSGINTFEVSKNIDKVGNFIINNDIVGADGKINVGNITLEKPGQSWLIGSAALTIKKVKGVKQLAKVTSNISVANEITKGRSSAKLHVSLFYTDNKGNGVLLGNDEGKTTIYDEYAPDLLDANKLNFQLIKGSRLRSNYVEYGEDYLKEFCETPVHYVKNGGMYIVDNATIQRNFQLGTYFRINNHLYSSIDTYGTYKEAIDVINARNDKSAIYEIKPLSDTVNAGKMIMPKANAAKALYFAASDATNTFYFTKTDPTLTCDLYLDSVGISGLGKTTINVGKNKLTLKSDAFFTNGVKAIKGAGVTKKNSMGELNGLILDNMSNFEVDNITGVGQLKLVCSTLSVYGTTSIGTLITEKWSNTFNGGCTIKTAYNKKTQTTEITGITSNTTINTGITNASEESMVQFGQVTNYKGQPGELYSTISEWELSLDRACKSKNPIVCILKSKNDIRNSINIGDEDTMIVKRSNGVYSYYVDYYQPDFE